MSRKTADTAISQHLLKTGKSMIAAYIDEILMFRGGLWIVSVGYGYLPFPGNAASRPPVVRHFKSMGPCCSLPSPSFRPPPYKARVEAW
jgi:hypothetical protein